MDKIFSNDKIKATIILNINIFIISYCSMLYMDDKSRLIVTIPSLLLIVSLLFFMKNQKKLSEFLIETKHLLKNKLFICFLVLNILPLLFNFSVLFLVVILSNFVTILWSLMTAYLIISEGIQLKFIHIGLKYSHLIFLLYSFFVAHKGRTRFFGIYRNYNTNAIVTSFFTVIVLADLFYSFQKSNKKAIIYNFLLFSFGFYLTMLTHSRVALGVIVISGVIAAIFSIYGLVIDGTKPRFKTLLIYVGVIILFLVALSFNPSLKSLTNSVVKKIIQKGSFETIFDGRDTIWLQIMKDTNFFGNGIYYFVNNTFEHIPTFAPHNGLFSILGTYGLLSSLFIFYYFSVNLPRKVMSLRNDIKRESLLLTILVFQFLIIYSIPESMSYRPVMFFSYILIAIYEYRTLKERI